MKIFILGEALEPHEKAEVDTWTQPEHSFSHHAFGDPRKMRTTIPLMRAKSPHETEIASHLEKHGYKLTNYQEGHVEDKHGRVQKLGKVLGKTGAPHLLEKYSTDPSRAGGLGIHKDFNVTISRHPHDVAGMTSNGHSWCDQSCMNFKTGSNKHYLPDEVRGGTHVAYLTHKDDHDIANPVARIALKPFHSHPEHIDGPDNHTILRPETKTYGNAPDSFLSTVKAWAHHHFPAKDDQNYMKHEESYHDSGSRFEFGKNAVGKAMEHPDYSIRSAAMQHPDLGSHDIHNHLVNTLERPNYDRESENRRLFEHPNLGSYTIDHHAAIALDPAHPNRQDAQHRLHDALAYGNRQGASEGVNDSLWHWAKRDSSVGSPPTTAAAILSRRHNLSDHLVGQLLDHDAAEDLSSNRQLAPQHISRLLNHIETKSGGKPEHDDYNNMKNLSGATHLTSEHADKIIDFVSKPSPSYTTSHFRKDTARNIASNPKLPSKHIDKLIGLNDPFVREGLATGHEDSLSKKHAGQLLEQSMAHHETGNIDNIIVRNDLHDEHKSKLIDYIKDPNRRSSHRDSLTQSMLNSQSLKMTPEHLKNLHDANPIYGDHIAAHPQADASVVSHVLNHPEHDLISKAVALNDRVKLNDDHINTLMGSRHGRQGLAARHTLPVQHLDTLVDNHAHEPGMANQLAIHPNVTVGHLGKLVDHMHSPEQVSDMANVLRYNFRKEIGRYGDDPRGPEIGRKILDKFHASVKDDPGTSLDRVAAVGDNLQHVIRPKQATSDDLHKFVDLHAHKIDKSYKRADSKGYRYEDHGNTADFLHNYLYHAPARNADHFTKLIDATPRISNYSDVPSSVMDHMMDHMSDEDIKKVHDHIQTRTEVGNYTAAYAGWKSALDMMKSDRPNSKFGKLPDHPDNKAIGM